MVQRAVMKALVAAVPRGALLATGAGEPADTHTLDVRATDRAGDATPASRTWRANTRAPDTTNTARPTGIDVSTHAPFEFASTATGSSRSS